MSLTEKVAAQLKQAATEDRHLAYLLRTLGSKNRRTPVHDIYRTRLEFVKGGYMLSMNDLMDALDTLQKLGCGKIHKRHAKLPEHPSFEWTESVQELAYIVFGSNPKRVSLPGDRPLATASVKASQTSQRELYATIRGQVIALQLPLDFGPQDAEELASYLRQVASRG